MDILEQFLTLPMIIFCLVVWVTVWLQRKAVELAFPKAKESKLWRELFLPLGPPGTGAILAAFIAKYPFPEMLTGSFSGRVFCGVVCGLCSGMAYRMLKKFFEKKAGVAATPSDVPPSE